MKIMERYPDLVQKTELWEKRVVENGFYSKDDAEQIVSNFFDVGIFFANEALRRKENNGFKIKVDIFTPESFFNIKSSKYRAKSPITFGIMNSNKEVILRGIQGTTTGYKTDENENFEMNTFLSELFNIARASNYTIIKLLRPEFTTHYKENVDVLIEMWRKMYPTEAEKRVPTVFDLHEMELIHQDRMKKLYYTISQKTGFEKSDKYFILSLK